MRKAILTVMLIGTLALGALALTGVLSTVKASPAAQTEAGTTTAQAGSGFSDVAAGVMMHRGGGASMENLAEALGISADELQAAIEEARTAAIDQALAEGQITQEQADALKAGSGRFGLGEKRGGPFAIDADHNALLADALGISVDELNQAYEKAFQASIDDAVAAGRLTEDEADTLRGREALFSNETFQSSMKSAFEAAVNAAVESGVITQSQADKILAATPSFGGGRGMRGGWFDGPGFGRGSGLGEFHGELPGETPTTPDATTAPSGSSG